MKLITTENGWQLRHDELVLLSETAQKPVVYVGKGEESVHAYRGNFKIEDYLTERTPVYAKEICLTDQGAVITLGDKLRLVVSVKESLAELHFEKLDSSVNRFFIRIDADAAEHCYGCGEQMSYFDLRGRNYPIWSSEPGVGRDKSTYVTWRSDVENGGAGGDYYTTNYPQPTYVSSNHYYLHVDSTAYADFNFRNQSFHELSFWEVPACIRIEAAPTFIGLLEKLTGFLGRQPELPNWVYNGLIIGVQGGSERSFGILEKTLEKGIPVSAVWCQDWCGKRVTSFGKRLQWDWHYHKEMYPQLPQKIAELHSRNIKFMAYINPYLVNDGELYQEGKEKGYFALRPDGSDYLVDFGEFDCGVVDLTNPDAFDWFKNVIIKYQIEIGVDGWMADFGEYLPVDDIALASGRPAILEHNHWPALWAKCNYEALVQTGKLGEIVYFMRAGGTGSQKYCTLMWAGDQSVDFSRHDGLATVISAALSVGMSGCGLSHSDIGGYTSLFDNLRTKEVFLRWAEMAAFTPVMRTHEGNRPDTNFQYYDDEDCMERLAKLLKMYTALAPYTKELVRENAQTGIPVQRPLFLHYEEDALAYTEQFEYLYGRDLLVAPVWQEGKDRWEVYLPQDNWIHLWTGKEYTGGKVAVEAPLGKIPVFYRKNSSYSGLFSSLSAY